MNEEKERIKYKELISTKFDEVLTSNYFQNIIKKLSFDNYQFLIAKNEHFESILNLLITQYYKHNPLIILFNYSKNEMKTVMGSLLKSKLNAGRCFIAVDKKTNNVVHCVCFSDHYDQEPVEEISKSQKLQNHSIEIFSSNTDHSKLNEIAQNKYGRLCSGSFQCKNNNVKLKRFLSMFSGYLALTTIIECGYEYWYGETTHNQATQQANTVKPTILFKNDYSNYIFNDGTNISYYFNKLKKERNYDDEMIKELKKHCQVHILLFSKKHYNDFTQKIFNNILILDDKDEIKKQKLSKL